MSTQNLGNVVKFFIVFLERLNSLILQRYEVGNKNPQYTKRSERVELLDNFQFKYESVHLPSPPSSWCARRPCPRSSCCCYCCCGRSTSKLHDCRRRGTEDGWWRLRRRLWRRRQQRSSLLSCSSLSRPGDAAVVAATYAALQPPLYLAVL